MDDRPQDFESTWVFMLVPLQMLIWPITLIAALIVNRVRWKYSLLIVGPMITSTLVWGWNFYLGVGFLAIFVFAFWIAWQLLKMQKI